MNEKNVASFFGNSAVHLYSAFIFSSKQFDKNLMFYKKDKMGITSYCLFSGWKFMYKYTQT